MWVQDNSIIIARDRISTTLNPSISTPYCNSKEKLFQFSYISPSLGSVYIICGTHPIYFYGFKTSGAFSDIFIPFLVDCYYSGSYHYYTYCAKGVSSGKYYSWDYISEGATFGIRQWDEWWQRKSSSPLTFEKKGIATLDLTLSKRDVLTEGIAYWRGSSQYGTYLPYSGAVGKKRFGFLRLYESVGSISYYEVDDVTETGLINSTGVRIYLYPGSSTRWILGDHTADGYWEFNGTLSQYSGDPSMLFVRVWNGSGPDPSPSNRTIIYSSCVSTHSYIGSSNQFETYVNNQT